MNINCIIMASGQSSRMGTNKLFLEFQGKKLYEHTLDLIKKVNFKKIILVSSYDEILEEGKRRGFVTIKNHNSEIGKSSSIHLGVEEVKDDPMMFFVCDQPLLSINTVEKLIDAYENKNLITYPVINNRRGAPVIFPPSFRNELLSLEKDEGGMKLVQGNIINEVKIDDEKELIDIDTKEAYTSLRNNYE